MALTDTGLIGNQGSERLLPMDDGEFQRSLVAEIPRLSRLAGRVVPSGTDMDDLVQDTVERAWRGRTNFRADSSLSTWLHRILLNRAKDLGNRARAIPAEVESLSDRQLFGFEIEDPAVVLERAADAALLRQALSQLAPLDRTVLALHDGEGWQVKEIAEACGLETAATHKRLQRARFRLAGALVGPQGPKEASRRDCLTARGMAGDYFEGLLGVDDRTFIESHLGGCTHCPPIAQALMGLRGALEAGLDATQLHADISRFLKVLESD